MSRWGPGRNGGRGAGDDGVILPPAKRLRTPDGASSPVYRPCHCCGAAGRNRGECGVHHPCNLLKCGPGRAADLRRSVYDEARRARAALCSPSGLPASAAGTRGPELLPERGVEVLLRAAVLDCPRTVVRVPRTAVSQWSRLVCRLLEQLATQLRAARVSGGPVPDYPALSVAASLIFRAPVTAPAIRSRIRQFEAGEWGGLVASVALDGSRAQRGLQDVGARARWLCEEGQLSKALRVLEQRGQPWGSGDEEAVRALFPARRPGDAVPPAPESARRGEPLAPSPLRSWVETQGDGQGGGESGPQDDDLDARMLPADRWGRLVAAVFLRSQRGSAPGLDGLRFEHMLDAASYKPLRRRFFAALADVVDQLCWGYIPEAFVAGRLFVIPKKNGGLRPLGAGHVLRKLAANIALRCLKEEFGDVLVTLGQVGVDDAGAYKAVAGVREARDSGLPVLCVDVRNAFNEIDRGAVLRAVPPGNAASPLVRALYGGATSFVTVGGESVVRAERGVVQGCPLSPILFAAALAKGPVAEVTEAMDGGVLLPGGRRGAWSQVWYADDGYIAGPLPVLEAVGGRLEAALEGVGLALGVGTGKTALLGSALPRDGWLRRNAEESSVVDILGVPMGSADGVRAAVVARVEAIVAKMAVIGELPDPQHQLMALRMAGAWARAEYLLAQVEEEAVTGDDVLRLDRADLRALVGILGQYGGYLTRGDRNARRAWCEALLPISYGGLGLRVASVEYSVARARVGVMVTGGKVRGLEREEGAQKEELPPKASLRGEYAQKMLDAVVGEMSARCPENDILRSRVYQLGADGGATAGGWLRQASRQDGTLILPPSLARTAVAVRLGLPVLEGGPVGRCPECSRGDLDAYGRHAMGCVGVTRRHDTVRDALLRVLQGDGGYVTGDAPPMGGFARDNIHMEVACSVDGTPVDRSVVDRGDASGRPGDVAVRLPGCSEWTFIDVTVLSTRADVISRAARGEGAAVANVAYAGKIRDSRNKVEATGARFVPVAFDAYGHLCRMSRAAMKNIAAEADALGSVLPGPGQLARPARIIHSLAAKVVAGSARAVEWCRDRLGHAPVPAVDNAGLEAVVRETAEWRAREVGVHPLVAAYRELAAKRRRPPDDVGLRVLARAVCRLGSGDDGGVDGAWGHDVEDGAGERRGGGTSVGGAMDGLTESEFPTPHSSPAGPAAVLHAEDGSVGSGDDAVDGAVDVDVLIRGEGESEYEEVLVRQGSGGGPVAGGRRRGPSVAAVDMLEGGLPTGAGVRVGTGGVGGGGGRGISGGGGVSGLGQGAGGFPNWWKVGERLRGFVPRRTDLGEGYMKWACDMSESEKLLAGPVPLGLLGRGGRRGRGGAAGGSEVSSGRGRGRS